MADLALTWGLGIDQQSDKTNLPDGAVTDAINVDIDRVGGISRRDGYSSVHAGDVHDLWTSEARGQSFGIVSGALSQINIPWAATSLYSLDQDAPFSYADLNGEIVASSRYEALVIGTDLAVRKLGLPRPGAPGLTANSAGGMDAGSYGVAYAYLRGDEEGPLSRSSFVTLTIGQGITIALATSSEATKIRLYRTEANGETLYRIADIPVTTQWTLGLSKIGRQCDTQFLDRMIPGDFACYWRGLLWVVRANVAFHSEPLRYGLYSPRFNFVQFANSIRLFQPVEGGIFVGTKDGVFFLSGSGPKDFSVKTLGGRPPWSRSSTLVPASMLGPEQGDTGQFYALWLADNGYVLGSPDGNIIEKQRRRMKITDTVTTAATVVHDRRVVTVVH